MSSRFVHLRVRTEYAIQDSIVRIGSLIDAVLKQGMHAVGISDFCNFFASVKFYQASIAHGIKPLIGVDLPCCFQNSPHDVSIISVYCQNLEGYRHATQLISKAYIEGQAIGEPRVFFEWLPDYTPGLIALSGGRSGWIETALLKGEHQEAFERASQLKTWFPGRLYLELQRLGLPDEEPFHESLVRLSNALSLPLVATNEVRFIEPHEYEAHEARVCIHEGRTLADERAVNRYTPQQYFRSEKEMVELFNDVPQALENTIELVKRCTLQIPIGHSFLPVFPVPNPDLDESSYLAVLAREGLAKKMLALLEQKQEQTDVSQRYLKRLEDELSVIQTMGFAGYFLIVADFIGWAKQQGIRVGPGRGSGAGSLVAYVLGITDLDPLVYDLLFERFLNPERISMPDFDVDFCMDGRDQVIDYVSEKYGKKNVSQIITFGSMAAKAVVRDVGRVLGHPYGWIDRLAKLIPFEIGMTLEKALMESTILKQRYEEEEVKELIDLAMILEGLVRNPGKHAGGVVIAPSQLTDFTALYCEPGSPHLVSQFDKDDVEAVGLVKFDFLGLRTLTIIDKALSTINQRRALKQQVPLVIEEIPLSCPATFTLLRSCQTAAVFQLESRGMQELMYRLQPDSFEELIALVALFRPGPLQSGMVDDFISRKHGRAIVMYLHPTLESILKETYGVILYQEQVMKIAQVLANYTLGAADLLRRAMGKKKPEEMAKQRAIFTRGAEKNDIDAAISTHIFDLMEKFAGYGFNKSHSAAYALISYQTAWLKTHYPAAFMAAVLSADLDHTDKVMMMVEECKRMQLSILPPSIEQSSYEFTVETDNVIRYGLGAIKGVGSAAIALIVNERHSRGPYRGLFEFCQRLDLRKINRRVIEALIKSGSMDDFGIERSTLLISLNHAMHVAGQNRHDEQFGQLDLFGSLAHQFHPQTYMQAMAWSVKETLSYEKEVLGLYLSGHPCTLYHADFQSFVTAIHDLKPKVTAKAHFCVLITGIRQVLTKTSKRLFVMTVEDASGTLEVVIFEEVAARFQSLLVPGEVIVILGDVSIDRVSNRSKIVVQECFSLMEAREKWVKTVMITVHETDQQHVPALKALMHAMPGRTPVELCYHTGTIKATLNLEHAWQVHLSDDFLLQVSTLLGPGRVKMILASQTTH